MGLLTELAEIDELSGGTFRQINHLRKIAYREDGSLKRVVADWLDSGIVGRPNIVTRAPVMVSVGNDGMRRIHPTREADRYIEIGAPYVKVGGAWTQVNLGAPTRGNQRLTWNLPQANFYIDHGGHFVKLAILLKGGYVPEDNMIAFPVGASGLTRDGWRVLREGVPVGMMSSPFMLDYANQVDTRPIDSRIVNLNGDNYWLLTLPDISGMQMPLIDPTFTSQPDEDTAKATMITQSAPTTCFRDWNVQFGEPNDSVSVPDRYIMEFDLTSIPAGATVTSAEFAAVMFLERSSNNRTARVYRMIQPWVEGTGFNAVTNDGATWNTYDGSNSWATAGANNTTSDREGTDIGSRAYTSTEATGIKTFTLDAAAVQEWISGAFDNNGMLFRVDTEANDAYYHHGPFNATPSNRPQLTIEYTAPTGRATIERGVGRGILRGAR